MLERSTDTTWATLGLSECTLTDGSTTDSVAPSGTASWPTDDVVLSCMDGRGFPVEATTAP